MSVKVAINGFGYSVRSATTGGSQIFGKVTIGTAASCTSTALPVTRTECCAFASGRSSGRWKGSSSSDWREALNTVMCSVTDGSSPLPKRTM